MDSSDIDVITASLRPLVGLPLSVARRAADLRGFHFGEMRPTRRGNGGAYVLHVQCPWRLENEGRIGAPLISTSPDSVRLPMFQSGR